MSAITPDSLMVGGKKRGRRKLSLYWCATDDHDEDWFVVAETARDAARFHEDSEGYGRGDATAERICKAPLGSVVGWPTDKTLLGCGGAFVDSHGPGRVLTIGCRVFAEGIIPELLSHA